MIYEDGYLYALSAHFLCDFDPDQYAYKHLPNLQDLSPLKSRCQFGYHCGGLAGLEVTLLLAALSRAPCSLCNDTLPPS